MVDSMLATQARAKHGLRKMVTACWEVVRTNDVGNRRSITAVCSSWLRSYVIETNKKPEADPDRLRCVWVSGVRERKREQVLHCLVQIKLDAWNIVVLQ